MFIVYNKVSIIMASGRELCYVLLAGILASYIIPFIALAKPTVLTCTILRLLVNFLPEKTLITFSLIYNWNFLFILTRTSALPPVNISHFVATP